MGNVNSNVHNAVKEQADNSAISWYKLLDVSGAGELVDIMKKCNKTKQYEEIDEKIRTELTQYLYDGGKGRMIPVQDLVGKRAGKEVRKKKMKLGQPSGRDNNVYPMLDIIQGDENGLYLPDKADSQFREVCWDIDHRGAVGETLLHFCFLNATSTHYDLAQRIIKIFPKLINDYYLSEEFYGESILHLVISNEDPCKVKFVLDYGVNVHQRCFGNFFTPEDQKLTRTDNPNYEWVDLKEETNYEGHVYWGEYPLSFAACCGQEECMRLLIAKGADPNKQDTNGNTALHMLVIHGPKMQQPSMAQHLFNLLVDKGARLDIKNRQGLTPLTLAAKLGRKEMYAHIQVLEREVHWKYGNVVCAAYPLNELDTIGPDGHINRNSALMHIVYGEETAHLDMMEGIVSHLLHEKWNTFVRRRFYIQFMGFIIYFIFFVLAFYFRPGTDKSPDYITTVNYTADGTKVYKNSTKKNPCYLLKANNPEDYMRFVCEIIVVVGVVFYLSLACREMYHQGYQIFFKTLFSAPMKLLHLVSCLLILMMVPGRAFCAYQYEDNVGVFAILFTAPYFLFFCRGFKIVGPFVVMIYKMVRGDLLRFITIYVIFLAGFSQAMFIVFRRVDKSIFNDPVESFMGMFIMSLGEFSDIYEQFDCSEHMELGKFLFVMYMILVTLLLVNMLIAMMGNTYTMVNETQKEWLRQDLKSVKLFMARKEDERELQRAGAATEKARSPVRLVLAMGQMSWAKIILVIEQTFSTSERHFQLIKYSQPLQDGRRALLINTVQPES